jgi:hypothetical protein
MTDNLLELVLLKLKPKLKRSGYNRFSTLLEKKSPPVQSIECGELYNIPGPLVSSFFTDSPTLEVVATVTPNNYRRA